MSINLAAALMMNLNFIESSDIRSLLMMHGGVNYNAMIHKSIRSDILLPCMLRDDAQVAYNAKHAWKITW